MRARRRAVNFSLLVVVNVFWAAQYPAYKVAGDVMSAARLNFWILAIAACALFPFWLREQRKPRKRKAFSATTVRQFLVLSLFGILPPSVMLAWGISHSSASNAAILSLTIPILMTLLGIAMLREKPTGIRIASLFLGLVGTLMVSATDLRVASFDRAVLLGNLVILLGCLGSAFYNTYSKALLAEYSELEVLIYSYVIGAVACAIICGTFEATPFYSVAKYSTSVWIAIGVLGVLTWGVAMVLWMWVLNQLEVGQISTSIYMLPLFGLILSVLTLDERITLPQAIGGTLAVAGTAMLTIFERPRQVAPSSYQ